MYSPPPRNPPPPPPVQCAEWLRREFHRRFPRIAHYVHDKRHGVTLRWTLGPSADVVRAWVAASWPGADWLDLERGEPEDVMRQARGAIQSDYILDPHRHTMGDPLDLRLAAIGAVGRATFPANWEIVGATAVGHQQWELVIAEAKPQAIAYAILSAEGGHLVETGALSMHDYRRLRKEATRYLGRWLPKADGHLAGFWFNSQAIAESWAKMYLDPPAAAE